MGIVIGSFLLAKERGEKETAGEKAKKYKQSTTEKETLVTAVTAAENARTHLLAHYPASQGGPDSPRTPPEPTAKCGSFPDAASSANQQRALQP